MKSRMASYFSGSGKMGEKSGRSARNVPYGRTGWDGRTWADGRMVGGIYEKHIKVVNIIKDTNTN